MVVCRNVQVLCKSTGTCTQTPVVMNSHMCQCFVNGVSHMCGRMGWLTHCVNVCADSIVTAFPKDLASLTPCALITHSSLITHHSSLTHHSHIT